MIDEDLTYLPRDRINAKKRLEERPELKLILYKLNALEVKVNMLLGRAAKRGELKELPKGKKEL